VQFYFTVSSRHLCYVAVLKYVEFLLRDVACGKNSVIAGAKVWFEGGPYAVCGIQYNCARFFSTSHVVFPWPIIISVVLILLMSWGFGTADCYIEQLTITTTLQHRTKHLVHPPGVALSTSKLCSNNGEVTYQLYSYVLIRNIWSGTDVTGLLMLNLLHLVLSDFCASMYFVSMKGHTRSGYETVNGVLKMKVNTWDPLALSVQGCFKHIICGWMGSLEGLLYSDDVPNIFGL